MDKRIETLLLGKIRHNLKTHLNVIIGYSELLLESVADEPELGPMESDFAALSLCGESILVNLDKAFASIHGREASVLGQIGAIAQDFGNEIRESLVEGGRLVEQCLGQLSVPSFVDDLKKIGSAIGKLEAAVSVLTERAFESVAHLIESGILAKSDVELVDLHSTNLSIVRQPGRSEFPSHILILDDNPNLAHYLGRKLVSVGHSVSYAGNTGEADDLLAKGKVALLILDILMPGENGYEFLQRNLAGFKSANLPVIVLSSLDELDTIYRCLEAGASDYVTKPCKFITLNARINSALERKYLKDREKEYLAVIEAEKEKSDNLLLNILPVPIADRLKAGEQTIADSFYHCSVLFADIAGFTPLSEKLSARELVDFLNETFSAFDAFTEELGLEKIKTIGDNYMVVAGIPEPREDHAQAIVEMAIRMQQYLHDLEPVQGHSVSVRVGINSGPVVAGVIGAKKFTYDLWGDTVNTASRMESHGVTGAIHLSDSTAALLGESHELENRGEMEIKGKGKMNTFLIRP